MEPFISHRGVGVALRRSNVDTDQILPSKYLKRITRSGFEDGLFAAWRSDPEFVLNDTAYSGASVLVAGPDFGTGSSREAAVWALQNYGFRAVIAPRFGDIFRTNCGKSGLLAIVLPEARTVSLMDLLDASPGIPVEIDLQSLTVRCGDDFLADFEVDEYTRWRMLNGLDDIAITLESEAAIAAHEAIRLRPPRAAEATPAPGTPRTMVDKIWERHSIARDPTLPELLYIDLHFLHEVSTPQAFDGLRAAGRPVRRPELTVATEDHNVPTDTLVLAEPVSRRQVEALRANCAEFGIRLHRLGEPGQGIVHVIGPESGLTQPGMTIVCGDSHTSTHGALGALAFGIGTSEVEHVLAAQTLPQARPKTMAVTVTGRLREGVSSKDLALTLIAKVGTGGGQGHVVEYRGEAIRALSIEARMSLCNMTIEWGARAGRVAPDATTFAYLRGREFAPVGATWDAAVADWSSLASDEGAVFDHEVVIDGDAVMPFVTWGTNPGQGVGLDEAVPDPRRLKDVDARAAAERALDYMGLAAGTPMREIHVDTVFIGSCTNSRIEDLRVAAGILRDRAIADGVRLLVVPGSMGVRRQAEAEGLDQVFLAAGGEWRGAGCSMCLGMNPDLVAPGERTASTSNRNFEGRQGPGARTHLVSPAVAAATAVAGRFALPGDLAPRGERQGGAG